jgi:hypothetical protein
METTVIEKKSRTDSLTQIDIDGLRWCLRARCTDGIRMALNHILIDGGLVVAIDGHRVHLYLLSNIELADGEYEIVTVNTKQIILRKLDETGYPDYMRVMPPIDFRVSVPCGKEDTPLLHTVYNKFANDARTYDADLLREAFMDFSRVSISSVGNSLAPLILYDNERRGALIMPLKNKP